MRRRVLIVASSYAPTMIADMHRARHLAWELPKAGWEVEVLCPDASYQQRSSIDADSAGFFSPETITHFVPQYCAGIFRMAGVRSIGWRAFIPMLLFGGRLLRRRRFDIVYITTTQFSFFLLGPAWGAWLGVPYVLDFHDPCYKENYVAPALGRPGLKHVLSNWLIKHIESLSVTAAAGLIAVSPRYIATLRNRYERKKPGWLRRGRDLAIPFAASAGDFGEAAARKGPVAPLEEGKARIVYVGAGGPIMVRAFSLLCRALALLRRQDHTLVGGVRMELRGTILGWQDGDAMHLADVAREEGVAELVREDPHRVSYRRSIELLLEGDGVLVLGVDDEGYMPSKLFSYALSGKPLLAAIRRDSPAFNQFQANPGLGHVLWFERSGEMPLAEAAQVVHAYLREVVAKTKFDRHATLDSYAAPQMANLHAELFEACVRDSGVPGAE